MNVSPHNIEMHDLIFKIILSISLMEHNENKYKQIFS